VRANGRRRKVHIQSLVSAGGTAITYKDKEELLLNHFKGHMGKNAPRLLSLDWEILGYTHHDLSDLDAAFS
jgi:hypothetical protein